MECNLSLAINLVLWVSAVLKAILRLDASNIFSLFLTLASTFTEIIQIGFGLRKV
jgi:hypothetical protein